MILRRENMSTALSALLLAALLLSLLSCGKRDWPAPVLSEDRYRLRTMRVTRAQNCMVVDIELAGAWQNLDSFRVLMEPVGTEPGDGCAQCPFAPRISRLYELSSPEVRRDMNRVIITSCGIDPRKTYRVQVVGSNVYSTLQLVMSDIRIVPPQ
jgi:hypothetical protein